MFLDFITSFMCVVWEISTNVNVYEDFESLQYKTFFVDLYAYFMFCKTQHVARQYTG